MEVKFIEHTFEWHMSTPIPDKLYALWSWSYHNVTQATAFRSNSRKSLSQGFSYLQILFLYRDRVWISCSRGLSLHGMVRCAWIGIGKNVTWKPCGWTCLLKRDICKVTIMILYICLSGGGATMQYDLFTYLWEIFEELNVRYAFLLMLNVPWP